MNEIIKQFVDNVYVVAKTKNIKIKTIEKEAEVSAGYLTRSLISVSLTTAVKIANAVDEKIDDLVSKDYAKEMRIEKLKKEIAQKYREIDTLNDELKREQGQLPEYDDE